MFFRKLNENMKFFNITEKIHYTFILIHQRKIIKFVAT